MSVEEQSDEILSPDLPVDSFPMYRRYGADEWSAFRKPVVAGERASRCERVYASRRRIRLRGWRGRELERVAPHDASALVDSRHGNNQRYRCGQGGDGFSDRDESCARGREFESG